MKRIFLLVAFIVSAFAASGVLASTFKLRDGRTTSVVRATSSSALQARSCEQGNPCMTPNICGSNSSCTPEIDGAAYTGYYFCSCTTGVSSLSNGKDCN